MADDLHDSYRILELEPGASLPTVKRAYRHLVKMWHPDHFAPGSKMELKAQEKLKEINLAYERLCKSRGQDAAGDADASEQNKKTRKSASPSDEETNGPRRSSSKKAEEDPAAPPESKGHSRKMGDVADDAPEEEEVPAPDEMPAKPPPSVRRAFGFRAAPKTWRRILLSAGVLLAGGLIATLLPRGFWAARLAGLRGSAPALSPVSPGSPPAPVIAKPETDKASGVLAAKETNAAASAVSAPPAPVPTPASLQNSNATVAPAVAGGAAGQMGLSALAPAKADVSAHPSPSAIQAGSASAEVSSDVQAGTISSFTVGSSKAKVVEVQGMPDRFTETRFQYGSSEVFFRNGRVVSWQDGNPRLKARKPVDLSALNLETFTVGSRRDEVVAVQGKPDEVTDTTYRYGSSVIFFDHDRVQSWRDGNPHLKTRELPEETVAQLATFTIGSRKDEVVEVQGLPDKFTETTFQYGSSTVFFQNGRVVSWISGDPPIKAKKP